MKNIRYNSESGTALVFALGLLALLLLIGLAFVGNSINYRKVAENNSARSQSRMFALSSVSRAAMSLMIYSHQFTKASTDLVPPDNFDNIFSFAQYDENGAVEKDGSFEFIDGLKGEKSLMLLPNSSSVVSYQTAARFNQQFAGGRWPGNWVFFTNGKSGDYRRIIGRAAWQVIGSPAQLMAPVFLRGHIDLDGKGFVPRNHRWGREIDEVFLDYGDGESGHLFSNLGAKLDSTDDTVSDYDTIYGVTRDSTSPEIQRWVERWFIPDFDLSKNIVNVSRISAETYSDDGDSLLRFNISELGDGVNWNTGDDSYTGLDQWYARFGINSADKANSEEAIKLLTQDSMLYADAGGDVDAAYIQDGMSNGLPYLRRIGSSAGTFTDIAGGDTGLAQLRKQIAANFNDYCDSDGIPTSDVPAADWIKSMDDTANPYTHPKYTGNEKTPYLYELGMNFGIVPSDKTLDVVQAVKDAATGKYKIGIAVKAAPIVKLCNIYPFDPDEKVNGKTLYENFAIDDFMRAYVNFGKTDFSFTILKAVLNGVTFSYKVTTQKYKDDGTGSPIEDGDPDEETKSFKVDTVTLASEFMSAIPDGNIKNALGKTFNFSGENWKRAGAADATSGSTAVEPVVFSAAEVKNSDGILPYPVKMSSAKDDKLWQLLECDNNAGSTSPMEFSMTDPGSTELFTASGFDSAAGDAALKAGVTVGSKIDDSGDGTLDEFKYAVGKRITGEEKIGDQIVTYSDPVIGIPDSVDIEEIQLGTLDFGGIRRAVLTANSKGYGDTASEIGVDYVKSLPVLSVAIDSWTNSEKTLTFKPDANGKVAGFTLGAYRNHDPRQNLNPGDWESIPAIKRVDDFIKPGYSEVDDFMNISDSGKGEVNKDSSGNNTLSPENNGSNSNMDMELAEEPGYTFLSTDSKKTETGRSKFISTAVIRNAPMMSPWEIGFIHRGVKWQTINLQKSSSADFSANGDVWKNNGTSYAAGDAAILMQIKMTDKIVTFGKINVNMLSHKYQNFDPELDKYIIEALFRGLVYAEDPAEFIKYSTRDSDGKFTAPPSEASGCEIDKDAASNIVTKFLADGNRKASFGSRLEFLNYDYTESGHDWNLMNAFSPDVENTYEGIGDNDAAREEIIGKTINLLCATTSTPSVVNVLVVAQSIRDNAGEQVRVTEVNDAGKLENPYGGSVELEDGIAVMECKSGRFDYLEYTGEGDVKEEDPDKNIYFDEITGEVKMFVRLYHDQNTGKMTIQQISYL
ncbi:MAG: hypothetical protein E7050_03755 [Lentisphaerae bacterium]|nr:hypothetical protein [Lentisphaerota bacterium]